MPQPRTAMAIRHALPALLLAWLLAGNLASAHNNPNFREELLLTLDVSAEPLAAGSPAHSEPFELDLPARTVELIWRIDGPAAQDITFSVLQDAEVVAEGLGDGSVSRLLRGNGLVIAQVSGADGPFTVEIHANVIDRS
jgi:hypothetical protein